MGLAEDREVLRQRWYAEGFYSDQTLPRAFDDASAQIPDAEMLIHSTDRPGSSTLSEIHAQGLRLAGALQSLGVGKGDVVAVQVPNWIEGAVLFDAILAIGAVYLPIVHIYGPAEVGFILKQSRAKALVVPDRWRNINYLERLERLPDLPDLKHRIIIGEDVPDGAIAWRGLFDGSSTLERPEIDADDVCVIVYTSGTTADPKGVQHTHNSLLAEIGGVPEPKPDNRPPASLATWPSGHIAGVLGLLRFFLSGMKTVLLDQWSAEDVARLVDEHKVSGMSGTPFFLINMVEAARQNGHDISSIVRYVVGAASVTPKDVEICEQFGFPAYRCYGSSEHPTATASTIDDTLEKRSCTDGSPLPGTVIRTIDDDGNDVPFGEVGEVALIGPEQFVGYTDDALNIVSFLPGGWFKTGDIGRLDADGFLTITDRKKDIIIRGGENISAKEVEDVLTRHAAVLEAAVVAMPDLRYGERVCAFVILKEGASLALDEVQAHFVEVGVARQKTPERIEVVDDFPRTPSGKIKKFELRDALRAEAAKALA